MALVYVSSYSAVPEACPATFYNWRSVLKRTKEQQPDCEICLSPENSGVLVYDAGWEGGCGRSRDFRAFIFHGRRQNLCKHSPCDTASRRQCHCWVPEASQLSTRLLPATQVHSDRTALLIVAGQKTKNQESLPFNKHYASTYRSD